MCGIAKVFLDLLIRYLSPITLEQWEQRSISDRLKETIARVWEYWL